MAEMYMNRYDSPLGEIVLACDGMGLTGLWFSGQRYFPHEIEKTHIFSEHEHIKAAVRWLDVYFSGKEPEFTPALHIETTPFRMAVIEKLLEISYGETLSYGELAERLGKGKGAAQAVGSAVGHNPVSIIVPCHRVIASNGSLTGYAGGLDRKLALLKLESSAPSLRKTPSGGGRCQPLG